MPKRWSHMVAKTTSPFGIWQGLMAACKPEWHHSGKHSGHTMRWWTWQIVDEVGTPVMCQYLLTLISQVTCTINGITWEEISTNYVGYSFWQTDHYAPVNPDKQMLRKAPGHNRENRELHAWHATMYYAQVHIALIFVGEKLLTRIQEPMGFWWELSIRFHKWVQIPPGSSPTLKWGKLWEATQHIQTTSHLGMITTHLTQHLRDPNFGVQNMYPNSTQGGGTQWHQHARWVKQHWPTRQKCFRGGGFHSRHHGTHWIHFQWGKIFKGKRCIN